MEPAIKPIRHPISGTDQSRSWRKAVMAIGSMMKLLRSPMSKPARAGSVGVDMIDVTFVTGGIQAMEIMVLQRPALSPVRRDIEERQSVGTEQPLVSRARQIVGRQRANAERQRTNRLRPVDDEGSPDGAGALADLLQVEQTAVGPVDVGNRDNPRALVDPGDDGICPAAAGIGFDLAQFGRAGPGLDAPLVERRSVF